MTLVANIDKIQFQYNLGADFDKRGIEVWERAKARRRSNGPQRADGAAIAGRHLQVAIMASKSSISARSSATSLAVREASVLELEPGRS